MKRIHKSKRKLKHKKEHKAYEPLILSFPIDLIRVIRDYLDQKDIFNFFLVCKMFNRTNDERFQKRFIGRNFNEIMLNHIVQNLDKNIFEDLGMFKYKELERLKRAYMKFRKFVWYSITSDDRIKWVGKYFDHKENFTVTYELKSETYNTKFEKCIYAYTRNGNGFAISHYTHTMFDDEEDYNEYEDYLRISQIVNGEYIYVGRVKQYVCVDDEWYDIFGIHKYKSFQEYNKHVKMCIQMVEKDNHKYNFINAI